MANEEVKKKKGKKKIIVIIVIIIAVIAGIAVATSGGGEVDKTPVMTITADEIIADYKNNELSADEKYKDKYITITDCTVKNINDGFFYVEAKDEDLWLYELSVHYNDDQKSIVASLSEKDVITITGKVSGTDWASDVKLEDVTIQVNE